jgi:triosephosphate isomerase
MRQKMIVGNWKMFKTPTSSKEFVKAILPILGSPPPELKVVLCAPFTHLSTLSESLYGTPIHLGAQNLYWEEEGAYTGEISGNMLKSIGVEYVILVMLNEEGILEKLTNPSICAVNLLKSQG